jgi:hypothetical protein
MGTCMLTTNIVLDRQDKVCMLLRVLFGIQRVKPSGHDMCMLNQHDRGPAAVNSRLSC